METLASYGILPGDVSADTVLTGAAAEEILSAFSEAAELPYEASGAEDAPLSRGELAEIIMAYVSPLM